MTAPVAELRSVQVKRGSRIILRVEHLTVSAGEVLAVVGPNGAGKSTLIHLLALLDRPLHGQVLFHGSPVAGNGLDSRRRMAVVFQEPLLLDTSVESNVRSGLALRGVPREEQKRRARDWMERFGIAHLARRSAHTLSGGEAQRTSLARALVLRPDLLLLDEPFAALDQPTRQSLIDDLAVVLSSTATTTVVVTHDRSEALRLGSRVAVLMGGVVKQVGLPADVFASPVDEEAAAFLGVETIVSGVVTSSDDGLATVDVSGHVIESASDIQPGAAVHVCIRPEDVTLSAEDEISGQTSARNHLRAAVRRIVPSGPYIRVELEAGFPLVSFITRRSLDDLALAPGREVSATFKATAVHLIRR